MASNSNRLALLPTKGQSKYFRRLLAASLLAVSAAATSALPCAAAETITIYSAGSLKNVVEELAKEVGPILDLDIKPTFYSSGLLRQRIEKGETPDLFLSADMASPQKLADAGRTIAPAIAFAQNRMCLTAKRATGVTQANLVDRMLAPDIRIRTSEPVADPAGDYAVIIFDRIDKLHPGAGDMLRDKAKKLRDTLTATPRITAAELFRDNRIDMAISYCSGAAATEKEVQDLVTLPFPPGLEPEPIDGMAILSQKPGAMRLALFLLSEKGQAIVKKAGLLPLLDQTK
jgi:molybdate transport system substrate-binding protein